MGGAYSTQWVLVSVSASRGGMRAYVRFVVAVTQENYEIEVRCY